MPPSAFADVRRGPPPILFMLTLFVPAGGLFAQNAANAQMRTVEGREDEKERHSLFPRAHVVPSTPRSFPLVAGSIKAVRTGRKYVIARPKVPRAGIGRKETEKEDKKH